MSENLKICTRCIMDTTAPGISFDESGVCNFCSEYFEKVERLNLFDDNKKKALLEKNLRVIKDAGKGKEYDCIIGVSGGLDSSYVLYNAVKMGLRPLAVHLDNGWNSEVAVSNIEKLVKSLDVDLYTYVINWEEFKNLQQAFFRANVIDIEMLTDHAIQALIYKVAYDRGVKYMLMGTNVANEGMKMPVGWNHLKVDLKNILAIHNRFGSGGRLKSFPMMSIAKYIWYTVIFRIKWLPILDYIPFSKDDATEVLSNETGWRPSEKKHYESIFTRFYQGYLLPKKFNVDKRKLHYSTLICSGQLSRAEAIDMMKKEPYDNQSLLREDESFVLKKLGMSHEELETYLNLPAIPHSHYPSSEKTFRMLLRTYNRIFRSKQA